MGSFRWDVLKVLKRGSIQNIKNTCKVGNEKKGYFQNGLCRAFGAQTGGGVRLINKLSRNIGPFSVLLDICDIYLDSTLS